MNFISTIHAVAMKTPVKQSAIRTAMNKALTAYTDRCQRALGGGYSEKQKSDCIANAKIMYRLALPPLGTYEEIHAYIACVAQGVALGIFSGRDGSQLLYAAQVALSVVQLQRKDEACKPKEKAA
ncbi:MAG: hypothetical protein WAN35_10870 [Terracidiphilus sp.]